MGTVDFSPGAALERGKCALLKVVDDIITEHLHSGVRHTEPGAERSFVVDRRDVLDTYKYVVYFDDDKDIAPETPSCDDDWTTKLQTMRKDITTAFDDMELTRQHTMYVCMHCTLLPRPGHIFPITYHYNIVFTHMCPGADRVARIITTAHRDVVEELSTCGLACRMHKGIAPNKNRTIIIPFRDYLHSGVDDVVMHGLYNTLQIYREEIYRSKSTEQDVYVDVFRMRHDSEPGVTFVVKMSW